jgi:hypothetical protein
MRAAMRLMEDRLGATLGLPPGSRVLDANLRRARAEAARLEMSGSLGFHRLDYADLAFGDRSFDGAYAMETLVHAFDRCSAGWPGSAGSPPGWAGCCGPRERC